MWALLILLWLHFLILLDHLFGISSQFSWVKGYINTFMVLGIDQTDRWKGWLAMSECVGFPRSLLALGVLFLPSILC